MSEFYEACDTVRAMLAGKFDGLTDERITGAARRLGWPIGDPHPYLVAEHIEKTEGRAQ